MNTLPRQDQSGSTLVVSIAVVATILALLGSAVGYTQHISRVADRSRKAALATEVADGHLEFLFSSWRNIQRSNNPAAGLGTNYFPTVRFTPSPAPNGAAAPSPIPILNPTLFPDVSYDVTQYRIQAVTPMVQLESDCPTRCSVLGGSYPATFTGDPDRSILPDNLTTGSIKLPPGVGMYDTSQGSGSSTGTTAQYSYYYLAAVDVSVPVMTGNVTAKVRRVFEKKIDNAWGYALFYMNDLELHPSAALTINGPVMTNSNLYISTSLFTATNQYDSTNALSAVGKVSFAGDYVNSFAPYDARSGNGTLTSSPNFVAGMPPVQEGALLPFGWDVTTDSNVGTSANNDNYREIIEIPVTGADAFSSYRYYNQADIRVLIDASNNVTITAQQYNADGTRRTNADGSPMHVTCLANSSNTSPNFNQNVFTMINAALTRNIAFADYREATFVRVANLDISRLKTDIEARKMSPFFTGVIYITDTSTNGATISAPLGGSGAAQSTTERGIRLINGASLPSTSSTGTYYGTYYVGGLTIVSGNPVYIRGDYNTGGSAPLSNATGTSADYSKPNVTGYTRQPSAVMGDAINVQSALWSDANTLNTAIAQRTTQNTTINTALLAGNVLATSSAAYSGGGENFIRLNEDWNGRNLTYYGSAVQLFQSIQGARTYTSASSIFRSPTLRWYWDPVLGKTNPPGNLKLASYLQQQRWYQVY